MNKITLAIFVSLLVSACVRQPTKSLHVLYETNFESSQKRGELFAGWETRINHGYELHQGGGRNGAGMAMALTAGEEAKAMMVSGRVLLDEQPNLRLTYAGHLKTDDLVGESSLFMRVFAQDELIFQDDLKGYALSGDQDWTRMEVNSPMLTGATRVEYGVLVIGAGNVYLDDVSLVMNTNTKTHPTAFAYANEALEKIKQNSLYVISPQVNQQFIQSLAGAQQPADVHGSIVKLLAQIGDDHAKFIPFDVLQKVQADAKHAKASGLSSGSKNQPVTTNTPQGVGYIRIPPFKKKP